MLLGQLVRRAEDHRRLTALDTFGDDGTGRHLRAVVQGRDANALVDFVAVAEAFSTGRLVPLLPAQPPPDLATWKKRTQASRRAGVDLTLFPGWSALMGFVDVRNALQHRLGRLTDMQLERHRTQTLAQIAASGVDLNGDLLTVTGQDADRCYRTCAAFIRYLDERCPVR